MHKPSGQKRGLWQKLGGSHVPIVAELYANARGFWPTGVQSKGMPFFADVRFAVLCLMFGWIVAEKERIGITIWPNSLGIREAYSLPC